jgi:uncharacterized short protein YbdD (DUF466 family)
MRQRMHNYVHHQQQQHPNANLHASTQAVARIMAERAKRVKHQWVLPVSNL